MAAAQTSGFEQVMQEQLQQVGLLAIKRGTSGGNQGGTLGRSGMFDGQEDEDAVEYTVPAGAGPSHASQLFATVSAILLRLRRILATGAALQRSPSLDAASVLLTTETTEILQCERASLFLYDRQRDELWARVY